MILIWIKQFALAQLISNSITIMSKTQKREEDINSHDRKFTLIKINMINSNCYYKLILWAHSPQHTRLDQCVNEKLDSAPAHFSSRPFTHCLFVCFFLLLHALFISPTSRSRLKCAGGKFSVTTHSRSFPVLR